MGRSRVVEVVVLVPVKSLHRAKTRLRSSLGTGTEDLAMAMAMDVVAAALDCGSASCVVVVSQDRSVLAESRAAGAQVIVEPPGSDLNTAVRRAAESVRKRSPQSAVLVQPADCPCVTGADFERLVPEVEQTGRLLFVSDVHGVGTTTLAAPAGMALRPRYGDDSRRAHREEGARELSGTRWRRLSLDVDTPNDLERASSIGVGPRTARWLQSR